MELRIARALWGMTEGATLPEKMRLIADAGYTAVESATPEPTQQGWGPAEWRALVADHGLVSILQIFPAAKGEITQWMERAAAYEPDLIVSHSGRDRMTHDEGCAFFESALAAERAIGIPVAHETHRHRLFFSPWDTARYLRAFPDLRITADFSHWCVVCESLLDDMTDFLDLAMERTIHLHARVGYSQGPQVPHPAAPEYADALAAHGRWWDNIHALRLRAGAARFTATAEFGPPHYMHLLPFTEQPVSDLWKVCLWMKDHLEGRWPE